MSGIMMALVGFAGGGSPVSFGSFTLNKLGLLGSSHTGTFLVNTDGSISHTTSGTGSDGSSADTKWFNPITTGIGNSYFVKFVLSVGDAWNAGLVSGTVYDITIVRSLAWTATTGNSKNATVAVTFYSDAGGANQVASGTLTVDVESIN